MSSAPELFSVEAEEGLIGSILIHPATFTELDLQESHFYVHKNGFIWRAVDNLFRRNEAVDVVTICEELDRMGKLKDAGGSARLSQLSNDTPSSLHASAYAEIIKDYSKRRQWHSVANRMVKIAHDMKAELEREASTLIDDMLEAVQTEGAASHISDYTSQVMIDTENRMANPSDIWGIPTGFKDFDDITGGLQTSEILYLSGEPGVGKSLIAMQMALQMGENNFPGAIYSLEMPGKQVLRRLISGKARVPTRAIKTGRITEQQWAEVMKSISAMNELPIFISDAVHWTTASIRADLSRLKAQEGVMWFALDYAYLLQDGRGLSENDRTGYVSSQLKAICRALDLAGVVIHSLNKAGMGGTPGGEHLRGSGQQFYDTDLLLFVMKSEIQNRIDCFFGKGRELEKPKQAFGLQKISGEYPWLGNAAR